MLKSHRSLLVSLICLAAVLSALISILTPATELTRFRNSLLAAVGEPGDFDWIPGGAPAAYKSESLPPPDVFADAGRQIRQSDARTMPLMIDLVLHLRSQPKRRGPIKSTTIDAYQKIIASGRGYCADYTQVFNGLAYSVALPVREWGLSFDRFGGDGHAFSEVYDVDARQWIFVDPFRGFYVQDRLSGRPLSVLDFRERLASESGFDSVEIVPIGETFSFDSDRDAFRYFEAGADQFYLWFGNNVFTYDQHPVVRLLGPLPRPVEQLVAIMLRIHPGIRIVPTDTNRAEIASLLHLRNLVIGLAAMAFLIGLLACIQAVYCYKASRETRASIALSNSAHQG